MSLSADYIERQSERYRRFAWIKTLQVGDVLRAPSGVLRIVRSVQHSGPSLGKTSVCFLIRHCSWTGRCYTVLTGCDLATIGYVKTGARAKLNHGFDRAVEHDMGGIHWRDAKLTCCAVRGIP